MFHGFSTETRHDYALEASASWRGLVWQGWPTLVVALLMFFLKSELGWDWTTVVDEFATVVLSLVVSAVAFPVLGYVLYWFKYPRVIAERRAAELEAELSHARTMEAPARLLKKAPPEIEAAPRVESRTAARGVNPFPSARDIVASAKADIERRLEAVSRSEIPASEISIGLQERGGSWSVRLWNEKAETKTGVRVRLVSVEYYSPLLEQGKGGYVVSPTMAGHGPYDLVLAVNSRFDGTLPFDHPAVLVLIRSDGALVDHAAGKAFELKQSRLRLTVNVEWREFMRVVVVLADFQPNGPVSAALGN